MSSLKYLDSLKESLDEASGEFQKGDRIVLNADSQREVKRMKQSGKEYFGDNFASFMYYPPEQIYIFSHYYGSNAVVTPEGEDDHEISANAGRFEPAPMEEMNTTSSGGGEYATPHAFSKSKKSNKHTKPKEYTYAEPSIYESLLNRIHEISYKDFKNDDSATSKQKINSGIKEIARQLYEMDRSLTRVMKLKTEVGADQSVFLKSTMKKFAKINERLLKLSNKVREFSK